MRRSGGEGTGREGEREGYPPYENPGYGPGIALQKSFSCLMEGTLVEVM